MREGKRERGEIGRQISWSFFLHLPSCPRVFEYSAVASNFTFPARLVVSSRLWFLTSFLCLAATAKTWPPKREGEE